MLIEFEGEIIYWRGPAPYLFIPVPEEPSQNLKAISTLVTYGWGVIPIQARIFAVADVFDALTSNRSYRKKSSAAEAVQYLKEKSNRLFDPFIVEAFSHLPYTDFVQGKKASP